MQSKYPTTFYRVSVKALIRNTEGKVLVVKENGSAWSLPGGGIDHGESAHDTLVRELYEEALITSSFSENIIGTETMYMTQHQAWLLWLVYEVKVDQLRFGIGKDADDVALADPHQFAHSTARSERLVYKYAQTA
jgi:8-oxo-dGTP pyrophosphatase MutT (NUDIX family)